MLLSPFEIILRVRRYVACSGRMVAGYGQLRHVAQRIPG